MLRSWPKTAAVLPAMSLNLPGSSSALHPTTVSAIHNILEDNNELRMLQAPREKAAPFAAQRAIISRFFWPEQISNTGVQASFQCYF
ncbi:MAG: hypothetical protein H6714_00490 [Myxococcales bacterium]|nr:hypothetical protein [Myxococcales bacterium]